MDHQHSSLCFLTVNSICSAASHFCCHESRTTADFVSIRALCWSTPSPGRMHLLVLRQYSDVLSVLTASATSLQLCSLLKGGPPASSLSAPLYLSALLTLSVSQLLCLHLLCVSVSLSVSLLPCLSLSLFRPYCCPCLQK